ncbi:hypothetical protein [Xenorhabdus kozodoii]|uniref:Uncharacterized protein n=1 Tax=Xenorhabdus kozodoii TaxID=351676 RepID=A0A2D0LD16_9GAMM|nr:hypothetical protein [Xenorhabdus kozodoii]PHM73485.1 hypothetical protein Xkoz_01901 [Xenorhabdus kozodoii]
MNKNIMFVLGLDSVRVGYLERKYNQKRRGDGDVYLTIDILNSSLGWYSSTNNLLNSMNDFIKNKNIIPNISCDIFQSNCQKSFYLSLWLIIHGNKSVPENFSLSPQQEKELMVLVKPETVVYLLKSWGDFLNQNLHRISLHSTFTRRVNNLNKNGSGKFYSDYKAGFLAKNIPFHYVKEKKEQEEKIRSGKLDANYSFTYPNLINELREKDYTSHAFESYLRSDKEGILNMLNFRKEIERIKNLPKVSRDYEKMLHGELITRTFAKSYWRKISKLAVDWIEGQAKDPNSPIKGLIFYMEDDNRSKKYNVKSNIDERNLHHNWRHCDYKDIGSLDYRSAIGHSELRYVRQLMHSDPTHHIELVYVNDKGILNRIKKHLSE